MKIRFGFVSNSSSTAFLAMGYWFDSINEFFEDCPNVDINIDPEDPNHIRGKKISKYLSEKIGKEVNVWVHHETEGVFIYLNQFYGSGFSEDGGPVSIQDLIVYSAKEDENIEELAELFGFDAGLFNVVWPG